MINQIPLDSETQTPNPAVAETASESSVVISHFAASPRGGPKKLVRPPPLPRGLGYPAQDGTPSGGLQTPDTEYFQLPYPGSGDHSVHQCTTSLSHSL